MSTVSEVNLIDVPKEIPAGGNAWAPDVVRKLALDIAKQVDSRRHNMRIVQPKDNLLPIVVGLSGGALKPEKFGGDGSLERLPVTYLGDSAKIRDAKEKNPEMVVIKASLIEVGQIVFLAKNHSRVFIADKVEDILKELK
jgi:hypothetical protein